MIIAAAAAAAIFSTKIGANVSSADLHGFSCLKEEKEDATKVFPFMEM